jgi:hypothetical protein
MLYGAGHTFPVLPSGSEAHLKVETSYRPIRVRIVSNTVVTKLASVSLDIAEFTPGISPGAVAVSPVVDVEPTVGTLPVADPVLTPGISPPTAAPERTHASAKAANNRFMDCLL